jgi:predicted metal-binding membrane protein
MLDRVNRILFGGLIGWLAGYSFATALLPFALQALAPETLAYSLPLMAQWGTPATVLWAPLGAAAALAGNPRRSGAIFGAGALVVGLLYGLLVAAQQWQVALASPLLALVYGWGAGSLLGGGFGPLKQSGGANAP